MEQADVLSRLENLVNQSLGAPAITVGLKEGLEAERTPKAKNLLEKRIFHEVGKAIADFTLIEEGDKILVAVSGGKDSWVMLSVLSDLKKRAPVNFDIIAVNIDQGWAGFRQDIV